MTERLEQAARLAGRRGREDPSNCELHGTIASGLEEMAVMLDVLGPYVRESRDILSEQRTCILYDELREKLRELRDHVADEIRRRQLRA